MEDAHEKMRFQRIRWDMIGYAQGFTETGVRQALG